MYNYLGADPISILPKDIRTELEYGTGLRLRPVQQVMIATGVFGLLYLGYRYSEKKR